MTRDESNLSKQDVSFSLILFYCNNLAEMGSAREQLSQSEIVQNSNPKFQLNCSYIDYPSGNLETDGLYPRVIRILDVCNLSYQPEIIQFFSDLCPVGPKLRLSSMLTLYRKARPKIVRQNRRDKQRLNKFAVNKRSPTVKLLYTNTIGGERLSNSSSVKRTYSLSTAYRFRHYYYYKIKNVIFGLIQQKMIYVLTFYRP